MSWDLFIQDWGDARSLEEIPEDFQPAPIGNRSEIIEKVKKAEPSVDFSDPSWGIIENEHFSIEFNMGHDEKMDSFTMHVRGNEMAFPCIANILSELNLKAADGSTTQFFDIESSKQDMRKWIDFRNKSLNQ